MYEFFLTEAAHARLVVEVCGVVFLFVLFCVATGYDR